MANRFIYIIGVTTNPVKIGISDDVRLRLQVLQVGCPDPLVLHHAVTVNSTVAPIVESLCHDTLKERHRRGEWFDVDAEYAKTVVELHARREMERLQEAPVPKDAFLDGLDNRHSLNGYAPEAVNGYRAAANDPLKRKRLERMNRIILDGAGIGGLEVFKAVVLQRQALRFVFRRDPAGLRHAEKTLAKAVNALAAHFHPRGKQTLLNDNLDRIHRLVA